MSFLEGKTNESGRWKPKVGRKIKRKLFLGVLIAETPGGVPLTFYKAIQEAGADSKAKLNAYKKWLCSFLCSRHRD